MRLASCDETDPAAAPRSGVVTLLDEVLERNLHLGVVVGAPDDRGLLEDVLSHHLAVAFDGAHARADARQLAAHLEVRLVLVPQAALETSAHPGELRRVQREALL